MHSPRHKLFRRSVLGWLALGLLATAPAGARAEDNAAKLPWGTDLQKGLASARKSGKRVFVDFTGEG